jgi:hypothetical protein
MNAKGQRTEGRVRAALLQERGNGRLDPEVRSLADELGRRGIPVQFFLDKRLHRGHVKLHRDVLVAGHIPVVVHALRQLGVEPPPPDDYPQALRPWLRRRTWNSTVGEVVKRLQEGSGEPFFVKPTAALKRFTGRVVESWNDLQVLANASDDMRVICSDVVQWRSEHRVYVANGRIVGTRHYLGDPELSVDVNAVRDAVAAYQSSGVAPAGYGIDFGVLATGETALVEVNEGYGLGSYGLDDAAYADLIISRWCELASIASKKVEP